MERRARQSHQIFKYNRGRLIEHRQFTNIEKTAD